MNIAIAWAFVAHRKTLLNIDELQNYLATIETKYDSQFSDIFDASQFLMTENKNQDAQQERIEIGYKK